MLDPLVGPEVFQAKQIDNKSSPGKPGRLPLASAVPKEPDRIRDDLPKEKSDQLQNTSDNTQD